MADIPWLLFIAASLALIATPGQDLILVMSRSISRGSRAGVITAAGVSVGLTGHAMLAALGLGAVLKASEALFLAFKVVGVLYLVYLGIRLIMQRELDLEGSGNAHASHGRLFWEGAFSNLSNPKVALFYLAFLPQFITPEVGNPAMALIVLGLAFAALTFLVKGPIGYFGGRLSTHLRSRPSIVRGLYRVSGMILIGLGVRLAFERQP